MFACVGAMSPGVSIKTNSIETAALLIEMGAAERAAYLHRSWVKLDWDVPDEELQARLEHSYRLIRASLPKKVQAGLG
jgi:predicted DNA-binding protein (MmcQ/YjbR family)